MTHSEIILKLIGPVEPLGDSSRDPERLENLKQLAEVANELTTIMENIVFENRHSHEASVIEIRDYADQFLKDYIYPPNE